MLNIDLDYCFHCYEIDPDDKLVFISETKPQIVTVHENRFVVPLHYYKSTNDNWDILIRDTCYDILYHVSDRVKCVKSEDEAKKIFVDMDIPFDNIVEITRPGKKTLKFALADKDFLGIFVARTEKTAPVTQIGAFMWMKSIIRIE